MFADAFFDELEKVARKRGPAHKRKPIGWRQAEADKHIAAGTTPTDPKVRATIQRTQARTPPAPPAPQKVAPPTPQKAAPSKVSASPRSPRGRRALVGAGALAGAAGIGYLASRKRKDS